MKKAYICSPYRGKNSDDLDRNIRYAQELTRKAVDTGYAPVTPHLYLTQCLDDSKEDERAAGMAVGEELLILCDVVFVGDRYGISEGMVSEIALAREHGIKVTALSPGMYDRQQKALRL